MPIMRQDINFDGNEKFNFWERPKTQGIYFKNGEEMIQILMCAYINCKFYLSNMWRSTVCAKQNIYETIFIPLDNSFIGTFWDLIDLLFEFLVAAQMFTNATVRNQKVPKNHYIMGYRSFLIDFQKAYSLTWTVGC